MIAFYFRRLANKQGSRPCKSKKIKCGEEKPGCLICERQGETCDYNIRLNWDGRPRKRDAGVSSELTISTTTSSLGTPTPAVGSLNTGPKVGPFVPDSMSSSHSHNDSTEPGAGRAAWEHHDTMQDVASYGGDRDMSFVPLPSLRDSTDFPAPGTAISNSNTGYHEPYLFNQGSQPTSRVLNPSHLVGTPPENSSPHGRRSALGEVFHGHRDKRQRLNDAYVEQNQSVPSSASRDELHFHPDTAVFPYVAMVRKEESNIRGNYDEGEPRTPSASSLSHEGNYIDTLGKPSSPVGRNPINARRLSINSLLLSPTQPKVGSLARTSVPGQRKMTKNAEGIAVIDVFYGVDRGLHDLDTPRNDDANVLCLTSPALSSNEIADNGKTIEIDDVVEFGFGLFGNSATSSDVGYYVQPVPVIIPKSLEPLPPVLFESPMNLMYFHHFLNHTARILVPHDCSENPFKNILPQSKQYFLSDTMVLVDLHQWLY